MNEFVIIVAGGSGSRMNSRVPKQFLEIKGEAVIIRTIRCFLEYNAAIKIIVCVHPDFMASAKELIRGAGMPEGDIRLTEGGATRFDSVGNGLRLVPDDAVVGIHDAARPFVSQKTIHNCFRTAREKGNAVPCVPVNESLREINGGTTRAVNRDGFRVVQTPQCFLAANIKKAFLQPWNPSFTDDATVLEAAGEVIFTVEGNVENIKITTPHDLIIANAFIEND